MSRLDSVRAYAQRAEEQCEAARESGYKEGHAKGIGVGLEQAWSLFEEHLTGFDKGDTSACTSACTKVT